MKRKSRLKEQQQLHLLLLHQPVLVVIKVKILRLKVMFLLIHLIQKLLQLVLLTSLLMRFLPWPVMRLRLRIIQKSCQLLNLCHCLKMTTMRQTMTEH